MAKKGKPVEISDDPLSERARQLYLLILHDAPAPDATDPDVADLLDFGLIAPHPDGGSGQFIALDPVLAAARRRDRRLVEASHALREAAAAADSIQDLVIAYRVPDNDATIGAVEHLVGMEAVNSRISELVAGATQEILTAQPKGPRRAAMLAVSRHRDLDAIRRGVSMRTIYRSSARSDSVTAVWVAEMTEAGAHVRTLDDSFERAIVIDRRVAVITDHTPWTGRGDEPVRAIIARDNGLAHFLGSIFDREWSRAAIWTGVEEPRPSADLTDLQISILRHLANGGLQPAIAEELGLSHRTVTHQVSVLKQLAGAATIFQLAMWWARRTMKQS